MGAFCCCPCSEEFEEYAHPSNPIYRHCICLRYFFHQLFSGYSATFQRLEGRTVASPVQAVTPLTSTGIGTTSADSSLSETYHLVPRPPPYDTDSRFSRSQRDGLVSRREKSMSHLQEQPQTLRRNGSSSAVEHLGSIKKRNSAETEEECKLSLSESEKNLYAKAYGTGYVVATSEDEDVCPTCLDEYTPENPKIVTKCSHHFHLSCIYEWMERSDSCPICGKEMEFCESP
ncbi:E3 ubiquitin-protein ligase At3g02290 isoform X1 [Elaeis guineensis]|nr:E3 ubiquitin-protein ligase At3g02290 isoform X2 [Elaeis guineensis]XP_010907969.1 E3 ubiquitin-protein ligase At3g02290 isoform X2 [Elaeis guineensis]